MKLSNFLKQHSCLIYGGPMETRIEYGTSLKLDKEMSIFQLIESAEGRKALAQYYCLDIEAVKPYNLPIILQAPTFRASREHCKRLKIKIEDNTIKQINQDCITFLRSICNEYPDYQYNILITAPVGPKYAGFTPDNIQDLAEEIAYHQEQINAAVQAGVDFIDIAAMPGTLEAKGAAIAASNTGLDYIVGFVLTAEGKLLDGTPVDKLIQEIDETTKYPPVGYIIACTHQSVAKTILSAQKPEYKRIIGIKANGSAKPPKELLKLGKPEADDPVCFAQEVNRLANEYHLKICGGCCGTDHHHIIALAKSF